MVSLLFAVQKLRTILWGRFHPFDPAPMSIVCGVRLGRRPSADEHFFEGMRLRRKCPPDTFVMDTFVYRTRKFELPSRADTKASSGGFGVGAAVSEENVRHRPPWTAGSWESKSSPGKQIDYLTSKESTNVE